MYSLLRLENRFLARSCISRLSPANQLRRSGQELRRRPERNTNGIVGPVPLTRAHPLLVEKLRVSQPGVLLEPFRISDWWLVVRLERYSPATFTDEISDRMCREMFDEWINEQTTTTLSQLNGNVDASNQS